MSRKGGVMQTQAAAEFGATRVQAGRFGWVKLTALGGAIAAIGPVLPMIPEGFEPFLAMMAAPFLVGLVLSQPCVKPPPTCIGARPWRFGNAKVVWPLPPYVIPRLSWPGGYGRVMKRVINCS